MNKAILWAVAGLFAVSILGLLVWRSLGVASQPSDKILVAGSFYPLAHFSERVGGDLVEVMNMTPAGTEPHDFEPTARDLAKLRQAKLFIYNGAGLDAWAEKIAPQLEAEGVKVVAMSGAVDLLGSSESHESHEEEDEHGDEHNAEHADDHDHAAEHSDASAGDPHFWLDPVIAQSMVGVIAESMSEIDSENRPAYEANAARYQQSLAKLDADFQSGLADCERREVIVSHNAFAYLAKRYNIETYSIAGLSPDREPSVRQLGALADLAREKNIKYVLFESLVSPKLADTLAREIGAQTLVFDPLEGLTPEKAKAGATYITVMEENLAALRTAMSCR